MSEIVRQTSALQRLNLQEGVTFEDALNIGDEIIHRSEVTNTEFSFMLGDLYNWFQQRYPGRMSSLERRYGRGWYQRMADCGWVARRFAPERRLPIPFYVYRETASLPEEIQNTWIWKAMYGKKGEVTRERLRTAKRLSSAQPPLAVEEEAQIIEVDVEDNDPFFELEPDDPLPAETAEGVYIACAYNRKQCAEEIRETLQAQGMKVSSTWHSEDPFSRSETFLDEILAVAQQNLKDLDNSQAVLLVLNHPVTREEMPSTSGGCHTELGYALAKNIPVYILGLSGNPYCFLCHYSSMDLQKIIEEIKRRIA